ncbi:MAG: ATP-binding protein [Actinobacteria bacterium]|nr:ATP-binding protein [Actinomycetota bacterium]
MVEGDPHAIVRALANLLGNAVAHGGETGTIELRVGADGGLEVSDEGPGIPDVDLALTDGWSSGTGLGLGLSGARRLVDSFTLDTEVGKGTTVEIVKWAR